MESLDPHLFQVNLKQSGGNSVHTPVSYRFDPPLRILGGNLTALIFTESYAYPSGVVSEQPYECLNTEMHMTIEFTAAAE